MKTLLAAIFILISGSLMAQDWVKIDPAMNQILADTTLLRATVATIEPGKVSGLHTHWAFYFYALTDCRLKVYYEDGQTEVLELKAGDSGYGNPEKPHRTENMGDKTAKFLLVELKEHPYKQ
jgi:quercetin dioxygenase-like cupin family protein